MNKNVSADGTVYSDSFLQQVFNRVVNGLASQGWRRSVSPGDDGVCKYRGAGAMRCALGHLIPDDKYDPSIEGNGIGPMSVYGGHWRSGSVHEPASYELMVVLNSVFPKPSQQLKDLLGGCQEAHDESEHPEDMYRLFTLAALRFGLTFPDAEPPPVV